MQGDLMPTEKELPSDIGKRVYEAFGREALDRLSPQEENMVNAMIQRILDDEGPEALTHDRLVGVKEMVTEHLWDPAYNGLV